MTPTPQQCGSCIRYRLMRRRRNINHFGRCMHPFALKAGVYWTQLRYELLDGTVFTPEASPLLHETHGQGCAGWKLRPTPDIRRIP